MRGRNGKTGRRRFYDLGEIPRQERNSLERVA
jgi:hypothetical protein